jgi:hypothetical protein
MDMRVVGQVLPPGVQHRGHADRSAEILAIGGARLHRLGRRPEQNVIDDRLVLHRDAGDRRRHGEVQVKVGHRERLGLTIGQPLGAGRGTGGRPIGTIGGTVATEDVRHLKRGAHAERSAWRHHH